MSANPLTQLGEQFVAAYYQAFATNKSSVISFYNVHIYYFILSIIFTYIFGYLAKKCDFVFIKYNNAALFYFSFNFSYLHCFAKSFNIIPRDSKYY